MAATYLACFSCFFQPRPPRGGWLVAVKTSQFEGLFYCNGERLEAFLKFRSRRPRTVPEGGEAENRI